MRAFVSFFVARWQFSTALLALLMALGLAAFFSIPRSQDPAVDFPGAAVAVILPGASAKDIERLVVIPLEQAFKRIDGVREVRSSSRAELGVVSLEFDWGTDPKQKFGDVVREVNQARAQLPDGVVDVRTRRFNPAQVVVVQVALTSEDASFRQMEAYANSLREFLEQTPGVQSVDIWGLPPTEVRVTAVEDRLAAHNVPIGDVAAAIRREGRVAPIGAVEASGRRYNLQTAGAFDSLDEIKAVPLRVSQQSVLTVGDIADIDWASGEQNYITRFNGARAVVITAQAGLGESVFDISRKLRTQIRHFKETLPPNIQLREGFDQAETAQHRLGQLTHDFGIALALVLLIVLPLGFRPALIVMISIPLSLAIGVFALYALGQSLNQLSIAGLVIALGLLVDDAIVAVENIARHVREGEPPLVAAVTGTTEIGGVIVGCTATLLLAFLPLLALPELAGEFFRPLPLAVVVTILASLVLALTMVPFLASRLLPRSGAERSNILLDGAIGLIHATYRPVLRVALGHPRKAVAAGLALFVLSLGLVPVLGFSVFPEDDGPYFLVDVEAPQGVAVSETDKAVRFSEGVLLRDPQVAWCFANSGRGNPQIYYNEIPQEQISHVGQLFCRLKGERHGEVRRTTEALRAELRGYAGARINLRRMSNGPLVEAPIAVRVTGADLSTLTAIATKVEALVRETPGTRDVSNPASDQVVDIDLNISDAAASLRGVPAGAIDDSLRTAVTGDVVAQYRDPVGQAFPVVVRAPREGPFPVSALDRLYVWNGQNPVRLAELSHPMATTSPASIDRFQNQRIVTVRAFTKSDYLTSGVTADVAKRLSDLRLPPGYTISFGGEAEAQQRSFGGLGPAILVAIFGILAVLLLQFKSFSSTAIVAFVIPFGVMGGLVALWLGGQSLSFMAIIGFIALIGIETKNSILLVEFANKARARGVPLAEAIEQAGELRFFPVLLTTATAIGGLTPLLLEDSPLFSPIALVLIGGLLSSTLLARIVIPAIYLLLAPKGDGAKVR